MQKVFFWFIRSSY